MRVTVLRFGAAPPLPNPGDVLSYLNHDILPRLKGTLKPAYESRTAAELNLYASYRFHEAVDGAFQQVVPSVPGRLAWAEAARHYWDAYMQYQAGELDLQDYRTLLAKADGFMTNARVAFPRKDDSKKSAAGTGNGNGRASAFAWGTVLLAAGVTAIWLGIRPRRVSRRSR